MRIKFIISLFVIISFISLTVNPIYAHKFKKEVLGDSVAASDIEVPPVAAGPGLILPDSPIYFMDNSLQTIKLLLITSPENKAEMRQRIAHERLAELRVMMAKNNTYGIKRALQELARENNATAMELENASLKGKDIRKLASGMNESMKQQRAFLDILSDQSKGALKLQLKSSIEELKEAKVEVENHLAEDELLKEVEDSIEQDIDDKIEEASESAGGLERSIDVLTRLASDAAKKEQVKREEILLQAIENKNNTIRRQEEKLSELKRKKEERIHNLEKEAVENARKVVESAIATAEKLDEAKKAKESDIQL